MLQLKLAERIKLGLILLIWVFLLLVTGKYGVNEINKRFGKKYQMLCNYMLMFNFVSDAGFLDYLKGKHFVLDTKNFVKEKKV